MKKKANGGSAVETRDLLRILPRVDVLIERYAYSGVMRPYLRVYLNEALERVRTKIKEGGLDSKAAVLQELESDVESFLLRVEKGSLRSVLNGTGVILHTNLGRAVFDCPGISHFASHYSNLEFDLETGERGSRNVHLSEYLRILTGCEAAIAVNNNAGAVILALTALSKEREAIVSRGEQVEIGGSFRIPDVAALSGAVLREVGTTNKTKIGDYERAIDERTGVILKVEPSNFKVIGQVESPLNAELYALAQRHGIPYYIDLGSGVFSETELSGAVSSRELQRKNIVQAVKQCDLLSFSGDKLLGGAQAGVIVGKKDLIDALCRHPLYRALRLDKLSIYALESALRHLLVGKTSVVSAMIEESKADVKKRVQKFITRYKRSVTTVNSVNKKEKFEIPSGCSMEMVDLKSGIGGGTFAISEIDSAGIRIRVDGISAEQLAKRFREQEHCLICRVEEEGVLIDFRTIREDDAPLLRIVINNVFHQITGK